MMISRQLIIQNENNMIEHNHSLYILPRVSGCLTEKNRLSSDIHNEPMI